MEIKILHKFQNLFKAGDIHLGVKFVRANSGPQISCAPILVGSCSFQKLQNKIKICELEIWPEFEHIPRA